MKDGPFGVPYLSGMIHLLNPWSYHSGWQDGHGQAGFNSPGQGLEVLQDQPWASNVVFKLHSYRLKCCFIALLSLSILFKMAVYSIYIRVCFLSMIRLTVYNGETKTILLIYYYCFFVYNYNYETRWCLGSIPDHSGGKQVRHSFTIWTKPAYIQIRGQLQCHMVLS